MKLALLAALVCAAPAAAQTRIGAAAAVSGSVQATTPGQVGRIVGSGKPLFLNDRVTTDAAGKLQVLLLDETVFTLGPNADMVLDEFVYDPATGAGKVAASITKGAFRFVTGKVARGSPESMNVKLKVGTIGIRGTVVVGETGDSGSTIINAGASADNNAGEQASSVLAENGGETVLIAEPGEGVTIKPNEAPSAPVDMSGQLDSIAGRLAAAPPPSGQQQASAESGEASDDAGQTTAQGGALARTGADVGETTEEADLIAIIANQTTTLVDGIGRWEDLVSLRGTANYDGSGSYTCGGTCSGSGSWDFTIDVNFDSKEITNGSVSFNSGPLSDSDSVTTTSYSGFSGTTPLPLNFSGSSFDATINFLNEGGEPGQGVRMNMSYDNGNDTAEGSADGVLDTNPPS